MRSEEALRASVADRRRRCSASAGRQTCPAWNDRQISGHHARAPHLLARGGHCVYTPRSEVTGIHRRHRTEHVIVMNIVDVREPISAMQRTDSTPTVHIDVCDVHVGDVDHTEASAVSTPPRVEPVTWTERQPSEAAPSAPTKTEAEASTPAPERDISWRPERVIPNIDRTRPPSPRSA